MSQSFTPLVQITTPTDVIPPVPYVQLQGNYTVSDLEQIICYLRDVTCSAFAETPPATNTVVPHDRSES